MLTCASVRLCICASVRLCVCASVRVRVCACVHVCAVPCRKFDATVMLQVLSELGIFGATIMDGTTLLQNVCCGQ